MVSEITAHRRAFWAHFAEALPDLAVRLARGNEHSRWLAVGPRPLILAHYVANGGVGLFVRGAARERIGPVRDFLFPHRSFLAERLGRPNIRLGTTFLLHGALRIDMADRVNWPAAAGWFSRHSPLYEAALRDLQARSEPWPDDFL